MLNTELSLLKSLAKITFATLTIGSLTQALAAPYSIKDLGELAEDTSFGRDINDNGVAVGNFRGDLIGFDSTLQPVVEFTSHGFIFDGIDFTDLGTLTPDIENIATIAAAINELDQVTGHSFDVFVDENLDDGSDSFNNITAFIYQDGMMTSLGIPEGSTGSQGVDININGIVVGIAFFTNTVNPLALRVQKALIITPDADEPYEIISALNGDENGAASFRGLNDLGQAVGWSFVDSEVNLGVPITHATFYDSTLAEPLLVDLGTLGGEISIASDINNQGLVIGRSGDEGNVNLLAFMIDVNSDNGMVSLGSLTPDAERQVSIAAGVNDNGQIVGFSEVGGLPGSTNPTHAFLYENDEMIDLNNFIDCSSGWTLITAESINNLGQIVGSGLLNGETHAFLLTPTPGDGDATPCEAPKAPDFSGNTGGGSLGFISLFVLFFMRIKRTLLNRK